MHCSCTTKIHAFEKENIALTLIGLQKQHDRMLLHVMNLTHAFQYRKRKLHLHP